MAVSQLHQEVPRIRPAVIVGVLGFQGVLLEPAVEIWRTRRRHLGRKNKVPRRAMLPPGYEGKLRKGSWKVDGPSGEPPAWVGWHERKVCRASITKYVSGRILDDVYCAGRPKLVSGRLGYRIGNDMETSQDCSVGARCDRNENRWAYPRPSSGQSATPHRNYLPASRKLRRTVPGSGSDPIGQPYGIGDPRRLRPATS